MGSIRQTVQGICIGWDFPLGKADYSREMLKVHKIGLKCLNGPTETSEAKPEMQKMERTKLMLSARDTNTTFIHDKWQSQH